MKVGLIDVDGHNFPNLALMKLSAYYKERGDFVEMYQGLHNDPEFMYDKVYMKEKAMEEYATLFNAISDAIEKLKELKQQLISAQQKAEEIFIEKE